MTREELIEKGLLANPDQCYRNTVDIPPENILANTYQNVIESLAGRLDYMQKVIQDLYEKNRSLSDTADRCSVLMIFFGDYIREPREFYLDEEIIREMIHYRSEERRVGERVCYPV